MTIVLLLLAATVLMATMLFLTIGINELEKKSVELGGLIRKRYTLRIGAKKGGGHAPTPGPAQTKGPTKP